MSRKSRNTTCLCTYCFVLPRTGTQLRILLSLMSLITGSWPPSAERLMSPCGRFVSFRTIKICPSVLSPLSAVAEPSACHHDAIHLRRQNNSQSLHRLSIWLKLSRKRSHKFPARLPSSTQAKKSGLKEAAPPGLGKRRMTTTVPDEAWRQRLGGRWWAFRFRPWGHIRGPKFYKKVW